MPRSAWIALAVAAVVLVLFLTLDFGTTAPDNDAGGPDEQWDAPQQPVPTLPPEGEALDPSPGD